MRLLWMITWDPRNTFGLAMLTVFVWLFVVITAMHSCCPCTATHESGARCAAANIPHNHWAHRILFASIAVAAPLHPLPEITIVAALEAFLIHYHSIKGHRFFFDLPFSL